MAGTDARSGRPIALRSHPANSSHNSANCRPAAPFQMPPPVSDPARFCNAAIISAKGLPSMFSSVERLALKSVHQETNSGSGGFALASTFAIAPRPTPVDGPRNFRSSLRAISSHSSRASPARTSGCLAIASTVTGEKRLENPSANAATKVPAGVCNNGVPALSSTAIFQRLSCAATRTASSRSGVTTAIRVASVSSTSRTRIAIARASSALSAASIILNPTSNLRLGGRAPQFAVSSGRQNMSVIVVAR